jgi:tetratricopeptide (TPR) repeat protein
MTEHAELELAHRYAAGELDPSATAAFEEHLLVCERCQDEVRLSVGLRQVARETLAVPSRRGRWFAATAAALAAGIAAVILFPSRVDRNISALGSVTDPPAYVGVAVRAMPANGDSLFAEAMNAYVAKKYDVAASGLTAALAAGVDTIPAEFFRASAQLMSGRVREAADGYARVIDAGPRAAGYRDEARLYRARALLRLRRANEALTELVAIEGTNVAIKRAAESLADSVSRVIKR